MIKYDLKLPDLWTFWTVKCWLIWLIWQKKLEKAFWQETGCNPWRPDLGSSEGGRSERRHCTQHFLASRRLRRSSLTYVNRILRKKKQTSDLASRVWSGFKTFYGLFLQRNVVTWWGSITLRSSQVLIFYDEALCLKLRACQPQHLVALFAAHRTLSSCHSWGRVLWTAEVSVILDDLMTVVDNMPITWILDDFEVPHALRNRQATKNCFLSSAGCCLLWSLPQSAQALWPPWGFQLATCRLLNHRRP